MKGKIKQLIIDSLRREKESKVKLVKKFRYEKNSNFGHFLNNGGRVGYSANNSKIKSTN